MNDRQLKYFCAVVDAGGAVRAASQLFVAPTAISAQIQLLEKELGGALFDRASRPMSLTPLGRFFYPRAKDLLIAGRRLHEEAGSFAAGKRSRIRIAFARSTVFSLLPSAVQALHNVLPDLQIDLLELLSEFQSDRLRSGDVDVGVARLLGDEEHPTDLRLTLLIEEPFVAVFPAEHRMARRGSIRLAELEGLPYISYPNNPQASFSRRLIERVAKAGVHLQVAQHVVEIHTALGLVAAGRGVTLVGASAAANNRRDIRFLRVTDCGFISRLVALTRAGEESEPVASFLSALKDAAAAGAHRMARPRR